MYIQLENIGAIRKEWQKYDKISDDAREAPTAESRVCEIRFRHETPDEKHSESSLPQERDTALNPESGGRNDTFHCHFSDSTSILLILLLLFLF